MIIIEKNSCTGCLACYNICNHEAIELKNDKKGFVYTQINEKKCIGCDLCKKVCPELTKTSVQPKRIYKVYACWAKSANIRRESTSGGAFYYLAKNVLDEGGVVFGASYNNEFDVVHKKIDRVSQLDQLMGSKYVQSNVGLIYRNVKKQLLSGKKCLFSGTPCQVSALKSFLQKDYANLICVDILCHGAPSPDFFREYREFIKSKYKDCGEINDIKFRNKDHGWTKFSMKIEFENGVYQEDKFHDPYLRAFLKNCITREKCHNCIYTKPERCGDITLGDFWGYWSYNRDNKNDDMGISMVMVNSEGGERLFQKVMTNYFTEEREFSEAAAGNKVLYKNYLSNKVTDDFWCDYKQMPVDELVEKHLGTVDSVSCKHKILNWIRDNAYKLPKSAVKIIEKKYIYEKRNK